MLNCVTKCSSCHLIQCIIDLCSTKCTLLHAMVVIVFMLHSSLFLCASYRPLTVMLYLLFLFLVVIILVNVLIAQVSETYTAVQSTARASLLFHRSRFITGCEESTALCFLLWTFRWRKIGSSCGMGYDVESHNNADQNHPKVG